MAFWPSRTDFTPSRRASDDIKLLVEYGDRLSHFIHVAKQHEPDFVAAKVIQKLAEASDVEQAKLASIFNSLENLLMLSKELGGAERALAQVSVAVGPDVTKLIEAKKEVLLSAIKQYDENNPVSVTFKAQKLTYQRERLFHEAEILTDARPVFDASGEHIIEMVVTHSLALTYWINSRFETIHVALDATDVLSLRKTTDRAIVKGNALKSALGTKWKTEVLRDEGT